MNREAERNRLVELIDKAHADYVSFSAEMILAGNYDGVGTFGEFASKRLLDNGVIVPPCKVGQTVYYVSNSPMNLSVEANTVYEAHISRIVTTQYGTTLVIQIHNSYGCTEIPDINEWGETLFATREEALAKLKGGESDA